MNKSAYTFAVLAACVVATNGAPSSQNFNETTVAPPFPVNWTLVGETVGEIESVIRTNVILIKAIALNDSETIGADIGKKIDEAAVTALAVLDLVNAAVTNQTLTDVEAEGHISTLEGTLARLIGSLQAELAQLSPEANQAILDTFSATFDEVEEKALELYALLGKAPATETP